MTCRVLGLWDWGWARCRRMKSIILCSPSPGTEASEMMISNYDKLQKCQRYGLSERRAGWLTYTCPSRIFIQLFPNPIPQTFRQFIHKRSTRSNRVWIPSFLSFELFTQIFPHRFPLFDRVLSILFFLFSFLSSSESSRSLLIHFRSRCDSINRHHQQFTRSNHWNDSIGVGENFFHHFVFVLWCWLCNRWRSMIR